ncbi:MAG TPA: hypothetical protein PKU97_21775 [Kofleriaceae bacterium]|nr:hypothetical protein [Kofleriaceae bacterium]
MRIGVVTTSFPRHRGDAAGHFVASGVELLRRRGHTVEIIAAGSATTPREERTSDGYAPTSLDHAQAAVREPSLRVTRLPSPLFYSGGAPEALPRGGLAGARAALSFSARLTITTLRRAGRVDP